MARSGLAGQEEGNDQTERGGTPYEGPSPNKSSAQLKGHPDASSSKTMGQTSTPSRQTRILHLIEMIEEAKKNNQPEVEYLKQKLGRLLDEDDA